MIFAEDVGRAKRWWKSKIIWLGGHLIAAAPVLEYARDNSALLHQYIGRADAAVSFALGAALVYLRNVTRGPIGKPAADDTDKAGA